MRFCDYVQNDGMGWCASGFGAQGRNRTTDTRIFSPLLYRLSYLGARQGRAVFNLSACVQSTLPDKGLLIPGSRFDDFRERG